MILELSANAVSLHIDGDALFLFAFCSFSCLRPCAATLPPLCPSKVIGNVLFFHSSCIDNLGLTLSESVLLPSSHPTLYRDGGFPRNEFADGNSGIGGRYDNDTESGHDMVMGIMDGGYGQRVVGRELLHDLWSVDRHTEWIVVAVLQNGVFAKGITGILRSIC